MLWVWFTWTLGCGGAQALPKASSPAGDPGAASSSPKSVLSVALPEPSPTRVVAIGDVHADLAATRAVFEGAGLADASGRWTGGRTVAVQTGDITDRGPDGRQTLAWLRALQADADAHGGRLVTLIGNHEAMNLTGDWRYVSAADLAGYGGEAARAQAFGPDGEDGAWLRRQDAIAQVGDTVFVHGGIDAHWARLGVVGLNAAVRDALLAVTQGTVPRTNLPAILGPDGPLWNRALVLGEEPAACPELARALEILGARRMVVGHTTQRDGRIGERCGGALYAIDTGISALYGNHRAVLEITGGRARPLPLATGSN